MAAARVLHDLSVVLRPGTTEWPGDRPYECGWTLRMAEGASINLGWMATSPHVGTHADAPLHVLPGAPGAEAFPLDVFGGPATVIELPPGAMARATAGGANVELADLEPLLPAHMERLLVRTGVDAASGFPTAWPALSPRCVQALCARGLRLLGVDAPSVDPRESKTLDTHRTLFGAGAYNLENLDLRDVPPGRYVLAAYPMRLEGLDAAPVRAVLLEDI